MSTNREFPVYTLETASPAARPGQSGERKAPFQQLALDKILHQIGGCVPLRPLRRDLRSLEHQPAIRTQAELHLLQHGPARPGPRSPPS